MERYVVRLKGDDLAHAAAQAFVVVAGKPGDKIHIYPEISRPSRHTVAVYDIPRRMQASDAPQHILVHGLGVDAYPVDTILMRDRQLIGRRRLGPPSLEGELRKPIRHRAAQRRQEPFKLTRRQYRRRPPADIYAPDPALMRRQNAAYPFDLVKQGLEIWLYKMAPFPDIVAYKGTV